MGARALKKTDMTKKFKQHFEGLTVQEFDLIMEAVVNNYEAQNEILVKVNSTIKERFREEGKTLESLIGDRDKQDYILGWMWANRKFTPTPDPVLEIGPISSTAWAKTKSQLEKEAKDAKKYQNIKRERDRQRQQVEKAEPEQFKEK